MKHVSRLVALLLLVSVAVTGCKKSHDDDHLDISGFSILLDNQVVASQSGTTVTGSIVLTPGVTTGPFSVRFLDPEGRELIINDADLSLSVQSSNAALFTTSITGYTFRVTTTSAGTGNITVSLMHGSHKDFESRPIPVSIASAAR